jgi:hypothetical protein
VLAGASRRSPSARAWAREIARRGRNVAGAAHHGGIAGKELPSVVDSREAVIRPVSDL